jgi:TPP-dependent 2-oxoacid decarboxylase
MGQFHQKGSWPTLMFQINDDGYYVDRQLHGMTRELKKILTLDDMKGKWNDILIHINSTKKDSGFYKI